MSAIIPNVAKLIPDAVFAKRLSKACISGVRVAHTVATMITCSNGLKIRVYVLLAAVTSVEICLVK
jgi:hypothetical protein